MNDTASDFNGDAVSGCVTDVPEPLTILGSATAIGFGVFFSRGLKEKAKK